MRHANVSSKQNILQRKEIIHFQPGPVKASALFIVYRTFGGIEQSDYICQEIHFLHWPEPDVVLGEADWSVDIDDIDDIIIGGNWKMAENNLGIIL